MNTYVDKITSDFNKIALLQDPEWNHNKHYHKFIERNLPVNCKRLLEIGCGKGDLCRQLSPKVEDIVGIDIAENMIEIANERTQQNKGIVFRKVNYLDKELEEDYYDCIVSVATLHHIDFEQFAAKVKKELKPGGRLLIVDLYQEETIYETFLDFVASPVSKFYKRLYNSEIKSSKQADQIWQEHGESDEYLTIAALKKLVKKHFPEGKLRRRLLWRYTLLWEKTE